MNNDAGKKITAYRIFTILERKILHKIIHWIGNIVVIVSQLQ